MQYAVEMQDIVKTFPGIVACDNVSLNIKRVRSTPSWVKTAPASPH